MDPFDVLGVPATATRDEIESAYRAALRRSHPDLHQAAGGEAVARAEIETRRLNEAIALLRAGWLPPASTAGAGATGATGSSGSSGPTSGPGGNEDRFGFHAGPDTDWFGNPIDTRIRAERVECPFCRLTFTDPVVYRSHLASDHGYGEPVVGPRRAPAEARPLIDRLVWLGWIPAAWLWFLLVLVAYWVAVITLIGDSIVASVLVWLGVAGYVAALALHHRFRRRSS